MGNSEFSLFDAIEYVIMVILPRLAFVGLILGLAAWLYLDMAQNGTDKAAAAEKVPAGTLKSVSVKTGWLFDTSTLTLEDGTTVAVSGTFNPWKAGQAITTAQVKYDNGTVTYWCAGQTCLKQR